MVEELYQMCEGLPYNMFLMVHMILMKFVTINMFIQMKSISTSSR